MAEAACDHFEVYAETLEEIPVVVRVSLSMWAPNADTVAVLSIGNRRWYEQFEATVLKDGVGTHEYRLALIPGSERFERHPSEGLKRDVRATLASGEGVYTLWRFVGPDGPRLEPGLYRVITRSPADFEEFFGIPGGFGGDSQVLVKERHDGDASRYTEDLVERHYLWGCWLHKFDRQAAKKEFERAWELVWDYLRSGAGDEPGAWNITPRWQAGLIAGWLDRPVDKISYLSQFLSMEATQFGRGEECKMRYYHFGVERGRLPRNVRDDLGVQLNRLYERVYGKTMSGRPAPGLIGTIPKNFPDEPDDSPEPAPSTAPNESP